MKFYMLYHSKQQMGNVGFLCMNSQLWHQSVASAMGLGILWDIWDAEVNLVQNVLNLLPL